MVDANTGYVLDDVRRVMPALEANDAAWLEEPFPAHDYRSYAAASKFGHVPLAAGENHYTRFEFNRVIEHGAISVLQPDLSKTGGITEALRIAAMASSYKLTINPHTSASGLNMSASIQFLCAIDNGGWFEADVAKENLFRDELVDAPDRLDANGCVRPSERPGLGVEVNEAFLRGTRSSKDPLTCDGPASPAYAPCTDQGKETDQMKQFVTRAALAIGATLAFAPAIAFGQAFPSKPIRIIVPYSPGGRPICSRASSARSSASGTGSR